nr:SPOR domain-containing protein [Parashewanella hymeniacidonis]
MGVIFLPDLLDGKNTQKEEGFTEIPLRPSFTQTGSKNEVLGTVDIPVEPNVVQESSDKQTTSKPKIKEDVKKSNITASTEVVKKESQTTEIKKVEVGFTIQLGSFNNAVNVNALVKKLRANGFTAYTVPKRPVDKSLTKVFVGPNISKSKLQKMQKDIERLTKLKGKIVNFDPVDQ